MRKHRTLLLAIGLVIFVISFNLVQGARSFFMLLKKERINIVLYSANTMFYSLGIKDNLSYAVSFAADLKVRVPGGYGEYRTGALGKLIALEKKTDIIRRTFSVATSAFTDYYFIPRLNEVYYGQEIPTDDIDPSFKDIIFTKSNANFIERIYIYTQFISRSRKFKKLPQTADFTKTYQGYFYGQTFREERKNVQILYKYSSRTASAVGSVLEGSGIRVADMTQVQTNTLGCAIQENSDKYSATAEFIASFFKCSLLKGKTGIYDIMFTLGDREQEWEINGSI